MEQKFKTREELEEYVKNNRTPFSEFEKRLDYSKFTKSQEKKKFSNKTLWRRIGYALASVVIVVALSIGGYFIHTHVGDTKCPFEMGTYVYESHKGNLEETGFNEESYIVLTEKELSGPGTFNIKDEKNNWSLYGQFYNCEWSYKSFDEVEKINRNYYFSGNEILTEYDKNGDTYITIYFNEKSKNYLNFIKI